MPAVLASATHPCRNWARVLSSSAKKYKVSRLATICRKTIGQGRAVRTAHARLQVPAVGRVLSNLEGRRRHHESHGNVEDARRGRESRNKDPICVNGPQQQQGSQQSDRMGCEHPDCHRSRQGDLRAQTRRGGRVLQYSLVAHSGQFIRSKNILPASLLNTSGTRNTASSIALPGEGRPGADSPQSPVRQAARRDRRGECRPPSTATPFRRHPSPGRNSHRVQPPQSAASAHRLAHALSPERAPSAPPTPPGLP